MKNKELRRKIIQASWEAGACHIGSALSAVEIIEEIFKKKKKNEPFFFKATGIAALYCKMCPEKAAEYLKKYPVPAKEVPGVIFSIGSMGHSLPVAVGLALADRKRNVYILLSDGEIAIGTTWECLLIARQHKLYNLKVYVDRNFYQALGKTEDIVGIEKASKFLKKLFPIKVFETVKGQGVSFAEGNNTWHYKNLTEQTHKTAMAELQ